MDRLIELSRDDASATAARRREDPVIRQKLAQCYAEVEIMRANQMRAFSRISSTGVPGPEGSIQKIFWSELNQRLQQIAQELLGPYGQLEAGDRHAHRSRRVVVRLPARARQHDRSRHVGNPAQHHRPLRARPAEELLMQFGLNENQVILRDSAREFFAGECPMARVRRADGNEHRLRSRRSGPQLAAQGYTGIIFDGGVRRRRPGHGGARAADGRGRPRAAAGAAVLDGGAGRRRARRVREPTRRRSKYLAPICRGDARATLALLESSASWDRADVAGDRDERHG